MEELVIVFSQSDYIIVSGGTEKCIKEQEDIINKNYMQIFPIKNFGNKYVGINLNRKFYGVYLLDNIPKLIDLLKKEYDIIGLNIHHIKGYNINRLTKILNRINLPITLVMHDYYFICQSFKLINSEQKFCGELFNKEKCMNCDFKNIRDKHFSNILNFLENITNLLEKIIVPSNYTKKIIGNCFPNYRDSIIVREHLKLEEKESFDDTIKIKNIDSIKIAYVGAPTRAKGFNVFLDVVDKFKENKMFEWFYFGNCKENYEKIKMIDVQIAKQGNDAMINALKQNGIDIVILWPLWPETYSYVLYEAIESGAYIFTNMCSGNIKDVVKKMNVGIIFENENEMCDALRNIDKIKEMILEFKQNANNKYIFKINNETNSLLFTKKNIQKNNIIFSKNKIRKNIFLTLLYIVCKRGNYGK